MLAIVGGTGLSRLSSFASQTAKEIATPYADSPVVVELFAVAGETFAFLPRHGSEHTVPPHRVNYRANIWALKEVGATGVLSVNAVGGIHEQMAPGAFMVPDQLIDYTHGRISTFFDTGLEQVTHIDFTQPFDAAMRQLLLQAAEEVNTEMPKARSVVDGGVYGVTQGPRLETAAEVRKLQRDGCDVVGMTAMPEAALARELELPYASLALSVNWAAGLVPGEITLSEIRAVVAEGMEFVGGVIESCVRLQRS